MLIAEVGLNHLGNISSANVLLDAVIFSEADAVTFQVREKSFYDKEKFANMQLSLRLYNNMCKEAHKYKLHKTYIFGIGIFTIIFSEMSVNYAGKSLNNTIVFYILPLLLTSVAYLILRRKLIYKNK